MSNVRQPKNIKEAIHFCIKRFFGRLAFIWRKLCSLLWHQYLRHLSLTSRELAKRMRGIPLLS